MVNIINLTTIVIIIIGIITFLFSGIRIVRPTHNGVVERLGKYKYTAQQGFNWIIPIIDHMRYVNITEQMVDTKPQLIITKDKLNAFVDAIIYFRVLDPVKSLYNADDYYDQIVALARTTLRAVIGAMDLAQANSNRNDINKRLLFIIEKETKNYGVDILRVEMQGIILPKDVQESMNSVVKAEQEKIAAVNLAQATETKADGEKRAKIKNAEAEAQSIQLVAKANADQIRIVNESAKKYFVGNAQKLKYLETFAESFSNNTKIILDTKSNIINVIGDMTNEKNIIPIIDQEED